jgi:hypothetical protein
MGEALFQFKCSTCERFSKPAPQGEEGEPGMVDSLGAGVLGRDRVQLPGLQVNRGG